MRRVARTGPPPLTALGSRLLLDASSPGRKTSRNPTRAGLQLEARGLGLGLGREGCQARSEVDGKGGGAARPRTSHLAAMVVIMTAWDPALGMHLRAAILRWSVVENDSVQAENAR